MKGRALPVRIFDQRAAGGSHGIGTLGALVLKDEGALEGILAAVEFVDDEGSIAGLHEDAFFREVEHIDVLHVEHHRAVGIAGVGLQPADDHQRQDAHHYAEQDHRPRQPVEADAGGHESVGLGIGRHLPEAQQQTEEKCRRNGGAQVMRHQIGQHLEDHGKGILLAQRCIEQAHHAVRQQHQEADNEGSPKGQGNLSQDVAVDD